MRCGVMHMHRVNSSDSHSVEGVRRIVCCVVDAGGGYLRLRHSVMIHLMKRKIECMLIVVVGIKIAIENFVLHVDVMC